MTTLTDTLRERLLAVQGFDAEQIRRLRCLRWRVESGDLVGDTPRPEWPVREALVVLAACVVAWELLGVLLRWWVR